MEKAGPAQIRDIRGHIFPFPKSRRPPRLHMLRRLVDQTLLIGLGSAGPQAVLRQGSGLSGIRGVNLAELLVDRCSCLSPVPWLPGELLREKGSDVLMGVPLDP